VGKYLLNNPWIFNAGNDSDVATALIAGFDINIEYALQSSPHGAYFWCAHVIEARFSAGVWSVKTAD